MIMKEAYHDENADESFGNQKVDLTEIVPLPEGYEKLFLALYFITIPYLVGLLFLFVFIAHGSFDSFLAMDIAMFAAVWGIGYEVCAGIALTVIFYKMIRFNRARRTLARTRKRKPTELHHVHKFL